MAYTKQTWLDGEGGGTPIDAARLTHMENGIEVAHSMAEVRQLLSEKGQADGYAPLDANAKVPVAHLPSNPSVGARVNASETTTSTSFADLATVGPTVDLVVPPSGKIAVDFSCSAWNSGANLCNIHFDVLRVSDLLQLVATDVQKGLTLPGTVETRAGVRDVVTGLPVGTTVRVRMRYAVNTGTGTFRRRYLVAQGVS